MKLSDLSKSVGILADRIVVLEARVMAMGRDLDERLRAGEDHPALSIPSLPDRKELECHPELMVRRTEEIT